MIIIKQLTKQLNDRFVLKKINTSILVGESVALLGRNGAGKSTLFKCMMGLMKPTAGTIEMEKVQPKKEIGYLGHESFLYDAFTPLENLSHYAKLYEISNEDEVITEWLKKVGLFAFRYTPIKSFSRGMLQRLAIARVLIHKPSIILLDEPHTGLDQEAQLLLNQLLLEQHEQGVTILLISHDLEAAYKLCSRFLVLEKGKILADFTKEKAATLVELRQLYEMTVNGSG